MEVKCLQISNANASHQTQSAQKIQSAKVEGSKAEEANESSSEKATEALKIAQKSAVAKTTGIGINFDKSA
jgi:hypothetical protein